jgi:NADH-quinone oxidoreductase subunit L
MDLFRTLFPANDYVLLAVILAAPLLGAVINGVFGKRLGKEAVTLMALVAVGTSFVASVIAFLMLREAQQGDQAARFVWTGWEWLRIATGPETPNRPISIPIRIAFSLDALSGAMALVVTGVGFLIHLYSTKYMEKDAGYHRYFAYLNLFIFSMLVLILGDSLPVLFVGWEGVGLCSYLLIGFWYDIEANAAAGKKAFIANRIGDFGLLVAMAFIAYYIGALDWQGIEGGRERLLTPYAVWPIGDYVPLAQYLPDGMASWLNAKRHVSVATLVGLALFLGCAGKSAQIPLYVWLPDAMAGPTPVSALIHAATMVTAGVYLVCRMAGVFVLSPAAMLTIAVVGAVTAVFAATIAFVQNDIKKVLAYSTVSQLGYMFLGVGTGAFMAGFFHVVTHAFFKACLFLGAGSVIYALHKRIHDTDASQDMRNMGGLHKYMPLTFWTFVAAWVAIIGIPLTSGFFSKDEIIFRAYASSIGPPVPDGKIQRMLPNGQQETVFEFFQWPSWAPTFLYALAVIGALMTAFYMTRLVIGIFHGEFRGWTIKKKWKQDPHEAHHAADEAHASDLAVPSAHGHAHHETGPLDGPVPAESPWQMTLPLVVLGALSLVAGALNAHWAFGSHRFDDWLRPVFAAALPAVREAEGAHALEFGMGLIGGAIAIIGALAAGWVYIKQQGGPAKLLAERFPGLYALVYDKWRIDELYDETVIGAVDSLAEFAVGFDKWVVDGIIARFTSFVVVSTGSALRLMQTGRVHAYAAVMVIGIGGLGWFFLMPHAQAKTHADHAAGSYRIVAAPGLGYQYRWDEDGDGKWDQEEFGNRSEVALNLAHDEKRTVRLQVKSAFGGVSSGQFVVHRPKRELDAEGPTTIQIERGPDGQLRGVAPGGQRLPGARPPPGMQPLRVPPQMQPQPQPAAPGGGH